MNIQDLKEKSKLFLGKVRGKLSETEGTSRYYTALIVVLVGLSSFGLGRLSVIDERREPIIIENGLETGSESLPPTATVGGKNIQTASALSSVNGPASAEASAGRQLSNVKSSPSTAGGKLVASKNGTKYYFPWCASNIAEKNKIWFASETEARAKGYQPAANCKGLR